MQRPQRSPCDCNLSPVLHHLLHQTFRFSHPTLSWPLHCPCVHGNLCKAGPRYSPSHLLCCLLSAPENLLPPLALQLRSPLLGSFPWWFLSPLVSLWDSSKTEHFVLHHPSSHPASSSFWGSHAFPTNLPLFPGLEPESGLTLFLALSRAVH